jgi:leader peptidase (prepilin peptidase) / N-methyltransferase
MLTGGIIQYILNEVSRKKDYPYKQETLSLILGIILWGSCFYFYLFHSMSFGFQGPIQLYLFLTAASICLSLFFIDLKHQIIPNGHNLLLFILGLMYLFGNGYDPSFTGYGLLSGLILFGLFFLIMVLTRSLGGGDVKMMAGMGLFLGLNSLINFLLISFLSGAIVSIILMIMKKKKRTDMIAFGPYLILGFIATMLFF